MSPSGAEHDPGGPLWRQPWLNELLVVVDGTTTALSDRAGTMSGGATGLYVADRRVVSVLDVRLGDEPTSLVASRARGDEAHVWGSARHLGTPGPDATVEVHRRRTLRREGMTEQVTVRSRAADVVEAVLTVTVAGDGALLGDVRAGRPAPDLVPALPADDGGNDMVATWSDERHLTVVRSSVVPAAVRIGDATRPTELLVPVVLDPGDSVTLSLDVDTTRLGRTGFDADPGAAHADWTDVRVRSDDPRLGRLVERSLDDLAHLLMTDPLDRRDVFAGAGTPWYLTLFGRDSLWAARMALPVSLRLAGGTLRTLARRQGRSQDARTAEAPGKILHEIRREQLADDGHGLALPPVYFGTVDATCLWVCLLHDAWRSGLPAVEVHALAPHLVAAMSWIESSCAADPDGLLRYVDETGRGLSNQGWKDSDDAMRRADGTIAPAPIALLEAQAYAVEAARDAATLGRALGIGEPARWERLGDELAVRVRASFWVEADEPYLAMAVAGDGRLVDGIGSNMGHVLGTGTLTTEEAGRVARVLVGSGLLGPHGLSTLSRANPAFNPIGYHTGSVWTHDTAIGALGLFREGHGAEAVRLVTALVDAGAEQEYRWPELSSGEPVLGAPAPYPAACRPQAWSAASAGVVLTVLLGLRIDVPGRTVRVRPPATAFGALAVDGLRFGEVSFAVAVDRDGAVTVNGLPDDVEVLRD